MVTNLTDTTIDDRSRLCDAATDLHERLCGDGRFFDAAIVDAMIATVREAAAALVEAESEPEAPKGLQFAGAALVEDPAPVPAPAGVVKKPRKPRKAKEAAPAAELCPCGVAPSDHDMCPCGHERADHELGEAMCLDSDCDCVAFQAASDDPVVLP